jgi:hypothetical protein
MASAGIGLAESAAALLLAWGRLRHGAWLTFALGTAFGLGTAAAIVLGSPTKCCGCYGRFAVPESAHLSMVFGMLLGARFLLLDAAVGGNSAPAGSGAPEPAP